MRIYKDVYDFFLSPNIFESNQDVPTLSHSGLIPVDYSN